MIYRGTMNVYAFFICLIPFTVISRQARMIETSDIKHFWTAYDMLAAARIVEDSIMIMQQECFDRSTPCFRKFVKARNFTPEEYVVLIRTYPAFWKSIRLLTEQIAMRKEEINAV